MMKMLVGWMMKRSATRNIAKARSMVNVRKLQLKMTMKKV